jgi:hypothetical protein
VVLDRDVLALDDAGFAEPFAERSDAARIARAVADESDNRHAGLLRARRERVSSRRAAKKRDEVATPHGPCLSARTTRYQIKQCCAAQQNLGANDRFESFASEATGTGSSLMSPVPPKAD